MENALKHNLEPKEADAAAAPVKKIEQDDSQALIEAAARGEEPRAALLIAQGANVHARDRWQRTALLAASEANSASAVPLITRLLEAGANANACDKQKRSSLDFAIASSNMEVICLLLQHNATVTDARLAQLAADSPEIFEMITESRAQKALEPAPKVRKRPTRDPAAPVKPAANKRTQSRRRPSGRNPGF